MAMNVVIQNKQNGELFFNIEIMGNFDQKIRQIIQIHTNKILHPKKTLQLIANIVPIILDS